MRLSLPRIGYGFLARTLLASGVPALAVYVPSVLISDRVLTLLPYALLGVGLYLFCARLLRLFNDEDRSHLPHLPPAGLRWVVRTL